MGVNSSEALRRARLLVPLHEPACRLRARSFWKEPLHFEHWTKFAVGRVGVALGAACGRLADWGRPAEAGLADWGRGDLRVSGWPTGGGRTGLPTFGRESLVRRRTS